MGKRLWPRPGGYPWSNRNRLRIIGLGRLGFRVWALGLCLNLEVLIHLPDKPN